MGKANLANQLTLGAIATTAALAAFTTSQNAEAASMTPVFSFANTSINYLDWSHGTERRTTNNAYKKDFAYLELEGGVSFDWGEFYGFADWENPGNSSNESNPGSNRRSAIKATSHIYLGDSPFSLYFHVYDFRDYGFDSREQDRVLGLGYRHTFANGLWFKPFFGQAWTESQHGAYDGANGVMAGWVLGYAFNAFDQNFSITNWHEQTFDRDSEYLTKNYQQKADSMGTNGAVGLWWHPIDEITAGIQYRYANNKLGTGDAFQNALIYSVKYNFL